VRSSTRHQLKNDQFRETTVETLSWVVENRSTLIVAAVIAAVALGAVLGGWAYVNYRNQEARAQLASAIEKYNAPLNPTGQPLEPGMLAYANAKDRAKAANTEFAAIADKYSFTEAGRIARYFSGITLRDMGDNSGAEKQLSQVADSRDKNVGGLAKLALANLYQNTNQTGKAVDLYKQLIDKPTASVGKWTAQFQLAELYQNNNQPQDARRLYEDLQKESPTTPVGQVAGQRLAALGGAPAPQGMPPAAPPQ
jgi:tetratricopeptide (TPR) repeat protein